MLLLMALHLFYSQNAFLGEVAILLGVLWRHVPCCSRWCIVIIIGAISLSEMIKTNCTLQYLNINSNLFGDVGIKAIATTFNKSRISELIMYNCNISGTGE